MTVTELTNTAVLLLGAGHETTASAIALGVLMLLGDPDRLASLRADAAPAVEKSCCVTTGWYNPWRIQRALG